MRLTESHGGFAAVIQKGDSAAGSISVILLENGRKPRLFERQLSPDGRYVWAQGQEVVQNAEEFQKFLARRRKIDPDSWLIELDVASPERFTAEMNALC